MQANQENFRLPYISVKIGVIITFLHYFMIAIEIHDIRIIFFGSALASGILFWPLFWGSMAVELSRRIEKLFYYGIHVATTTMAPFLVWSLDPVAFNNPIKV